VKSSSGNGGGGGGSSATGSANAGGAGTSNSITGSCHNLCSRWWWNRWSTQLLVLQTLVMVAAAVKTLQGRR
jgi:hypothetical protein